MTTMQPLSISWTGFWKGTPLHFPADSMTRKQIKELTSPGGLMLKQLDGLYGDGLTKKEIIQLLTQQLDDIEGKLREAEKVGIIVPEKTRQQDSMTKIFDKEADSTLTIWFMNIACLLHMKAIKDDEMNGWLVKEVHVDMKGDKFAAVYPAGLCVDQEVVSMSFPKHS